MATSTLDSRRASAPTADRSRHRGLERHSHRTPSTALNQCRQPPPWSARPSGRQGDPDIPRRAPCRSTAERGYPTGSELGDRGNLPRAAREIERRVNLSLQTPVACGPCRCSQRSDEPTDIATRQPALDPIGWIVGHPELRYLATHDGDPTRGRLHAQRGPHRRKERDSDGVHRGAPHHPEAPRPRARAR
jgi:hypothetical protein